jgi:hypothetical protein
VLGKPAIACSGILLSLAACSGGGEGSPTTMQGFVGPVSQGVSVPDPSGIQITVLGRDSDEFPVQFFQESEIAGSRAFQISGLPAAENVMFRVSGSVDDTYSFPIPVDGGTVLDLAAIPAGLIADISQRAVNQHLLTSVSKTLTTILGIVTPEGNNCSPLIAVDLVNRVQGTSVITIGQNGPFYFNQAGVLQTGRFSDPECTYVIFNVNPDNYAVSFIRSDGRPPTRYDITALPSMGQPNNATVGYKIPRYF